MKKCIKHIFFATTTVLAGMFAYNEYVANKSTSKNMLPTKNGSYYSWKQGNVFYTKTGSGKPVLLIHDISSASSSAEWGKTIRRLQKNYTVYTIDLLGCGLSDKPAMHYTVFMYVQLITSFIRDVIGEKTDVIATDLSSPVAIMANQMDKNIIGKIILINPIPLKALDQMPDKKSKIKQTLINLPLIGTFIYNILFQPIIIEKVLEGTYFARPQLITDKIRDTYYEAAHMDDSHGKYLYSSILGKYMNGDIRHAIKKIDKPVYLIESRKLKNYMNTVEEYRRLNSNIEVTYISNAKLYPQLETPEKTSQILNAILAK